ncbi:unnamed protein product [Knipowitschia caucasica]
MLFSSQVWFQNRRARSIKTGRLYKSTKALQAGVRGSFGHENCPGSAAFPTTTALSDILRPDPSSDDVPQIYSDWIQAHNNYISSPQSFHHHHHQQQQQQQNTLSSTKSDCRFWDTEQRQSMAPQMSAFLPNTFAQTISRPNHQATSSQRQLQGFRKPHSLVHNGMSYGAGGGVDQVVPTPVFWDQGHHGYNHHSQMGPTTSMGYISDLIYNAAIVTNFLEF